MLVQVPLSAYFFVCVFKTYLVTDDGGYENQNVYVLLVIKSKAMKSCTH